MLIGRGVLRWWGVLHPELDAIWFKDKKMNQTIQQAESTFGRGQWNRNSCASDRGVEACQGPGEGPWASPMGARPRLLTSYSSKLQIYFKRLMISGESNWSFNKIIDSKSGAHLILKFFPQFPCIWHRISHYFNCYLYRLNTIFNYSYSSYNMMESWVQNLKAGHSGCFTITSANSVGLTKTAKANFVQPSVVSRSLMSNPSHADRHVSR